MLTRLKTTTSFIASTLLLAALTTYAQTPLTTPGNERRIDDLIQRMTLEEKLGQLTQSSLHLPSITVTGPASQTSQHPANDSLALTAQGKLGSFLNVTGAVATNELQHTAMERSRLHIPLLFGSDVIHGYRTIYPIPLAVASSFDPALLTELTHMAGQEAATAGIRWVYSPMVDIARDPRWGRVMEGAGEDTYLGAAMSRAAVLGYQGTSLASPGSVAATVKHFAAYGAPEAGREYAAVDMSLTRLWQDYLPPYQAAVNAGVASVMTSFNTVNGVPSTSSHFLLTDVLRNAWNFQGITVTDFGAIPELVNHGVALDESSSARQAIHAGVDVEMMSHTFQNNLPSLIRSGAVSISDVDRAVRDVLRIKFALGLFDTPYVDQAAEVTSANIASHRMLARRAAEESFVLLKNSPVSSKPLLPLTHLAGKTIALLGSTADNPNSMLGAWSIAGKPSDVVTLRHSLEQRVHQEGATLLYSPADTVADSTSGFATALAIARRADTVLLTLGEPRNAMGEAASRTSLDLPREQLALLHALTTLGKPITVVVFSSRPLILTQVADQAASLLQAWAPGVEAGPALTAVLFGDVAPSGHLPMSFPRNVGQEPLYYAQLPTNRPAGHADLSVPPTASTKFLSRYIDSPNSPLFPFGYGLTYTSFSFTDLHPSSQILTATSPEDTGIALSVTARITNTGSRESTTVAQLYMRNTGVSLSQPLRLLKGFQRISLKPGESTVVRFDLAFADLAFRNETGQRTLESSQFIFFVGESSSATLTNKEPVTLIYPSQKK